MAKTVVTELLVTAKDQASAVLKNIDLSVEGLTKTIAKMAVSRLSFNATTGLGGMATYMAKSAIDWGKAVDDIADATGAAGQEASKLLLIAKKTGIGAEEATGAFAKFGKAISIAKDDMKKNGDEATNMFSRLGMSISDLEGKNVYEVFEQITDKMRHMADGADKDRVAMELFGRSGYQLHDMLSMSKEEMDKVIAAGERMGL